MRANQDIRERAKKSGVCQWEIAETLGISETHLCRKLRKELPEDEKQKIYGIIGELAGTHGRS